MSWLYSLVFAGLMFSSQNGPSPANVDKSALTPAAAVKQDETERFEQSYPLNANGRVSVSNINGSIVVDAWDRNEVKLEAVKIADSKETLSEVELKIESTPAAFSVETDYDKWKDRNDWGHNNRRLEVQFHLTVPRGAVLDEIETVNGSVTVANFSNYTKISAVNGNVKAANLRGTANLSTVNGEVAADFDQLETGSKISLSTVNGRVNLLIPSDSSVTLKADSVNGNIANDFGLPVHKGEYVGRDMYGKLGNGDVQIKLNSVNGQLSVGRKNDGKSPLPSTNLLPQKNKDDEDWDDSSIDNDTFINKAKINREVTRAVRKAQMDRVRNQKEVLKAQKELSKVKPEIARINAEALKQATDAINAAEVQDAMKAGIDAERDTLFRLRDLNILAPVPSIEKKSDTIPVKGIPNVSVDAADCAVSVRGWDRQEVRYVVTQLSNRRVADKLQFNENHTDSSVNLTIANTGDDSKGNFFNDLNRIRIEIFVPKKSNLKIKSNGMIRLEGVTGNVDLTGGDESMNIRDVDGKMTLTNTDGMVRLIGFRGQLDAKTGDGDLYLEGDFDKLTTQAVDGTVVLTVPESANATLLSNTDVESEGVSLAHDKDGVWQLGKGGTKYNFNFDGGNLVVKCLSLVETY